MEDMLLREIEKTGKVLEDILLKLGVTTREKGEEAYDTARTGLREGLGMDFDAVLGSDDIAGALTAGYGFGDDNLERFARILFLLAAGAPDDDTRRRTASATNTSKAAAPAASTTGTTSSRSSKSISDTAHQSMFLIAYLVIWATKSCSSSFSGS